jgi:hypothetical protein
MALNNPPAPGFNFVPSYQISGIPWVTSSVATSGVTHISFDKVTRFVNVKVIGASSKQINLAFTANGLASNHFYPILGGEKFEAEIRVKDLYLTCISGTTAEYAIFAGTTTIPSTGFPVLTGSSYDGHGNGLDGIG